MLCGSPGTVVFWRQTFCWYFNVVTHNGDAKYTWGRKNLQLLANNFPYHKNGTRETHLVWVKKAASLANKSPGRGRLEEASDWCGLGCNRALLILLLKSGTDVSRNTKNSFVKRWLWALSAVIYFAFDFFVKSTYHCWISDTTIVTMWVISVYEFTD